MNANNSLARLRDVAPPELLEFLSQILRLFPPEFQYRVRKALDTLPAKGDNMQRILEVVRAQWHGVQSEDWIRIAIVGPSQTGKATLLTTIEAGQSATSPRIFRLVETPGLAEYLGYEKANRFPEELDRADLILLLLDCRYEVSEATHGTLERLKGRGTPVLVVLNKCDLIRNPSETARNVQKTLGQRSVAISALRTRSIHPLFRAIVASKDSALYPLAIGFPGFRGTICRGIVTQASIGVRPGRSDSYPRQRSPADDRDSNQYVVENCPGLRPPPGPTSGQRIDPDAAFRCGRARSKSPS